MIARLLHPAPLVLALGLSLGCGQSPAPPAPATALTRPTTALTVRQGRVLAPAAAMVERGGLPGVFVVMDGAARFRLVRTGKAAEGRVEILAGLIGTEQLVTGDLREVRDGSLIQAPAAANQHR